MIWYLNSGNLISVPSQLPRKEGNSGDPPRFIRILGCLLVRCLDFNLLGFHGL